MSSFSRAVTSANAALLRTFGETVTFQPASGALLDLACVWTDDERQLPQGVSAMVWLREADLAGLPLQKGDTFLRNGATFRVVDPPDTQNSQRDGSGGITIYLRQVNNAPDA